MTFNLPTEALEVQSYSSAVRTPLEMLTASLFLTNAPLIVPTRETATPVIVSMDATPVCNKEQFILDETEPDGTFFSPGALIIKIWRFKNVGTWTSGYLLVFDHGHEMGSSGHAPDPVAIATTVAPGQTVDVTINLIALSAVVHYRADFYLNLASGVDFGFRLLPGHLPDENRCLTADAHKHRDCNQLSLINGTGQWSLLAQH
jgi:hypothetical protein